MLIYSRKKAIATNSTHLSHLTHLFLYLFFLFRGWVGGWWWDVVSEGRGPLTQFSICKNFWFHCGWPWGQKDGRGGGVGWSWAGFWHRPLSIWPPARHNLCHRYTRTRPRFAYNMSVWVPAYIYFNFYNSDAIPRALFSPLYTPQPPAPYTVFPPVSPQFFSQTAGGALNAL